MAASASVPEISRVTLASDNSTIAVTFNEAVYNSNGGSGDLEISDFAMSKTGGTAGLSGSPVTSISKSGNVYTLGIGLSGTPNGMEYFVVGVKPDAIYDGSGNAASDVQRNNLSLIHI